MNSELYGKSWDFPEDMRKHMKLCFVKVKNVDSNVEGFNRNKRLQSSTSITYPELKRIKNFFDTYKGTTTDAPFILNGENKMKDYVNSILSGARNSVASSEKIRRDTAMTNHQIDMSNTKVDMNPNSDTEKKTGISKYDLQVTESLKRINDIMKKIL
jgi:hypothetical protein